MRVAALLCALSLGCADPPPEPVASTHARLDVEAALDEAVQLHRSTRAEALRVATDPDERYELLVGPLVIEALAERADWATLFVLGDEAFEAELPRRLGVGQGPPPPDGGPFLPQPIHLGERGGLDASSCRACHFAGGPDGAGTATQVGLFRGDGARLSSATRRDAPHVMGLGWIVLLAREMEAELRFWRDLAVEHAAQLGAPETRRLVAQGIDFGQITAYPDGRVDTSGLRGISPDLVIRPLGHKGRHADVVSLADEALQVHLGLQSAARVARYGAEPEIWLGDGGALDRDGDGVEGEAHGAQAVLLGAYLSMLPVPQLRPPEDPALLTAWARGRQVFEQVGCAGCHVPQLRVTGAELRLETSAGEPVGLTLPLDEAALEPRPRQVDFGEGPDGLAQIGASIFAFTDLRRHDLGPALADPRPEVLPDGGGEIPGAVWLTRSLWGLADTAPYLHDGRAPTVQAAIEWHGGEAAESRAAWEALPDGDARALAVFLLSLTRAPAVLVE